MPTRGNATPIEPERPGARVPLTKVDVVGVGLNAMDYITLVERFPRPGRKTAIAQVRLEPGGQVATALTVCARLGLATRYLGSVGSDDLGRLQIASLRREGIDITPVRVVDGVTSQIAIAILEDGVGERTLLWHRDPRLTLPPEAATRALVRSGRLLHLDGCDSAAALRAARFARDAGIPVVIDIDTLYDDATIELLGLVDYLIAAEEFATEITGVDDPEGATMALAARFPQATTGVTRGPRGAIFVLDGKPEHSSAFDVEVSDTTGAGDVFHGAFIFGVLGGWDTRRTIRFAHAVAAMKCRKPGARTGIPGPGEVEAFLETAGERA